MVNIAYGNGKTLAFPKFPDVCLLQQINNLRSSSKKVCKFWHVRCEPRVLTYSDIITGELLPCWLMARAVKAVKVHSIQRRHLNYVIRGEIGIIVLKDHNWHAALRIHANQKAIVMIFQDKHPNCHCETSLTALLLAVTRCGQWEMSPPVPTHNLSNLRRRRPQKTWKIDAPRHQPYHTMFRKIRKHYREKGVVQNYCFK